MTDVRSTSFVKHRAALTSLLILVTTIVLAKGDDRAAPDKSQRQSISAPRLASALTIDGDDADWPKNARRAPMALDPDSDEFRGNARVAWDADFLYAFFQVAATKEMRNAGDDPAIAFKTGDTVELFLCVKDKPLEDRTPRPGGVGAARSGDYRVLMTMLRNTKPTVFGFDFVNPANNKNPLSFQIGSGPRTVVDHADIIPGASMATRKATFKGVAGFTAEAKIPWRYFRDYKPKAGDRLLFNLAINFSNESGNTAMGKAYWNGPSHMVQDLGIEAQIHPEDWGWLVLDAP